MGFDQYHEPPEELSQETRTLARIFASLTEEAEAINWYEQRLSIEEDPDARAIAEGVLFRAGSITDNADAAEEAAEEPGGESGGDGSDGSLGIGGLGARS